VAEQNPLKCVFQLKKFSTLENFQACAKIFYANAIRQMAMAIAIMKAI